MLVLNVHLLLIYTFTDFVDHCGGRYFVGVSAFVKVQLKVCVMHVTSYASKYINMIKLIANKIINILKMSCHSFK